MSSNPNPLDDRRNAHARQQSVLNVLVAAARPMSRKELHERLRRTHTVRQVESATVSLEKAGLIEVAQQSSGGWTPTTFRAVRPVEQEVG